MRLSPTRSLVAAAISAIVSTAHAAPIDLSNWAPLTLNFPGGQSAGNWVLGGGNTEVTQTVNADPSFYLNNQAQTSYEIQGSWQVTSAGGDDDYMGFVFGYQNSSNFYLFDWKAGSQGYVGTTAAEGMTIKKFTGATGNGLVDLSLPEFWENQVDYGDMDVLATNHSATAGWAAGALYNFFLDYNTTPGQFQIIVKQGVTELWNATVSDATFAAGGQFGFYNNSQANVRYAGFEQELIDPNPGPNPVPEPSTLALLVIGLAGLCSARLRRSQAGHGAFSAKRAADW